ncbi:hypothetical protein [Microcoleus sp. FACHB-68]|uniref:hypothetical protein n=1 Tax=Microcoleus sp. FACHB-68 TaxID=2692826 RepID=UPI001683C4FE|nr:hypothetical protein [Microcoleus sp. FACHB-68]MBD1936612.1 hypothetical protein [Microcoleus sp. FACHB-68]
MPGSQRLPAMPIGGTLGISTFPLPTLECDLSGYYNTLSLCKCTCCVLLLLFP